MTLKNILGVGALGIATGLGVFYLQAGKEKADLLYTDTPQPEPVMRGPILRPFGTPGDTAVSGTSGVSQAPKPHAPPSSGTRPTGRQSVALDEARKQEEDWEKKRADFFDVQLKLTSEEREQLTEVRSQTIEEEQRLMQTVSDTEAEEESIRMRLIENRVAYEEKVKQVLGKEKFENFQEFYAQFWNLRKVDRVSLHHPIK